MVRFTILSSSVLGLGASSMAWAAPEVAEPTGTVVEEVTVVARAAPVPQDADRSYKPTIDASTLRTTAPMLDTPQVVNVVPAQVIRDQRPRTLDDVLTNVSGITQGNTLAGTQDTLMKRGFGGNRDGSIMHNGMPLVQGRGFNAAAESVEVLKGPSSLLYGIMDPGGVINVVSKKPELTQHTIVSAEGSSYGGGKNGVGGTIDTTGPIGSGGKLAYRMVIDNVNEDYWRNFGTHRETLIAPSLAWYGQDTKAVLWYEYRKFVSPFDRGTALDPTTKRPLDLPATERLDEPFDTMKGESHLVQTSVDHALGQGWALHGNLSYNRETYDADQLAVTGVNTTKGTLSRASNATKNALSTDLYGTAYADGGIDVLGWRNTVQFGVDGEHRRIYRADLLRNGTTTNFSYLDPVYGLVAAPTTVSAPDSRQTDTLDDQSVFAQDTVHLTDKWIVVGGVRYMMWREVAGKGVPFSANTNIRGDRWLPRLGTIYKLTPVLSLYASYTQSLKPVSSIAPLSTGIVITSGDQPEAATSYEAGLKLDIPRYLTGTLAVYDIDKKNVLVSQYNYTTATTDWRTSGAARSTGIELDVAGRVTQRLSLIGSYAYDDARTTQDPLYKGNQLWNAARNTASLSTVYDFGQIFGRVLGDNRLRIGAGGHYVGRRPGDSANSFWLASYMTADAFVTYETSIAHRDVRWQLNGKNLFNATYYPSSVNQYFVAVGDARQVTVSAAVAF